jgi:hypothetical protein
MKMKILFGAVAVLALLAAAYAADLTGKWVAQIPGRQGNTETTFSFKAEGSTLTGTMSNPQGESQITEGKINGDNISFVIVVKRGEMEMKTTWKGVVSGDEIKFKREFAMPPGGMGGPGGGPGGGAPGGGPGGPGGGMGAPGGGPGGGMGAPGGQPEIIAKRAK